MTETIISIVGSLGFPIVVAWFLLVKMNKTIEANTKAIEKLENTLSGLCRMIIEERKPKLPI